MLVTIVLKNIQVKRCTAFSVEDEMNKVVCRNSDRVENVAQSKNMICLQDTFITLL